MLKHALHLPLARGVRNDCEAHARLPLCKTDGADRWQLLLCREESGNALTVVL